MAFTPDDLERILDKSLVSFEGFLNRTEDKIGTFLDGVEEKYIEPNREKIDPFALTVWRIFSKHDPKTYIDEDGDSYWDEDDTDKVLFDDETIHDLRDKAQILHTGAHQIGEGFTAFFRGIEKTGDRIAAAIDRKLESK